MGSGPTAFKSAPGYWSAASLRRPSSRGSGLAGAARPQPCCGGHACRFPAATSVLACASACRCVCSAAAMRLHALVKTTAGRGSTAGAHNERCSDCDDVSLCHAVLLAMTEAAGRVASRLCVTISACVPWPDHAVRLGCMDRGSNTTAGPSVAQEVWRVTARFYCKYGVLQVCAA